MKRASLPRSALLTLLVGVAALGCGGRDPDVLRVGVSSGPHAQILEVVAEVAASRGLRVQVVEFSDYVQPNAALADGSIDVNCFQHRPYLEQQSRDRGYRFESVGATVTFPMAAYSARHATLAELPRGALIALPNDPTNGARALRLLAGAGLISLPAGEALVSPLDVTASRGDYQLRELDAAQLPRVLGDVDLAVINTNYALESGLDPRASLLREAPDSPYANLLVVRAGEGARPDVRALVEAYHSPRVREFIEHTFGHAVVPAF